MSDRSPCHRLGPRLCAGLLFLLLLLLLRTGLAAAAKEKQPKQPPPDVRRGLGQCVSPSGTLLLNEGPGKGWHAVRGRGIVFAGDRLLALPGFRAEVDLGGSTGDVRLTLVGGIPEGPALESVVVVQQPVGFDFGVTLKRGRVLVTNRKDKGAVRLRVQLADQVWDLELTEPATEVALELFGHREGGAVLNRKPGAEDQPLLHGLLLVRKGPVDFKVGAEQRSLQSSSVLRWTSKRGLVGPLPLKQPLDWLEAAKDEKHKAFFTAVEKLRKHLVKQELEAALAQTLKEADAAARDLGVWCLGAVDDLPRLVKCLQDAQHADVRKTAVLALRHWLGRDAAHDQKLFQALRQQEKFPAGGAGIVVQFLHGFSEDQLALPETFEVLIDYLTHEQLAIRELASWHLYRLVPQGKNIAYDPAGSVEQQSRAQAAWRNLIPAGKLPPPVKPKE
jgi:hypothetical protein